MKKYLLSAILVVALAVTLMVGAFAADVSISSADELVAIMNDSSKWADNITLTANINLSGKAQSPIGDYTTPFTGTFDGAGHTISGLDITASGPVGLFGVVNSATIKNLTVEGRVENTFGTDLPEDTERNAENKLEDGNYPATGAIVGVAQSGSTLENLTNKATVSGHGNNGGVVGIISSYGDATITAKGCVNYGTVTADVGNCAGVIGRLRAKTEAVPAILLYECVNYADVTSVSEDRNRLGGVTGYVRTENGTIEITKCRNEGTVTGKNEQMTGSNIPYVGGIAGRCEVTGGAYAGLVFSECVNIGLIDSSRCGAGIVGYISRGSECFNVATKIERCINAGEVKGPYYAGGMISYLSSNLFPGEYATVIENCLNVAPVSTEDCGGGIIGRLICCDVRNCVNLAEVTGVVSVGALIGKYDGEYVCNITDSYYLYAAKSVGNESEYMHAANLLPVASGEATQKDVFAALDFETVWTMGTACPVPASADGINFNIPAGVVVEAYPDTTIFEETEEPEETEPAEEPADEPKETTEATTKAPKSTKATTTAANEEAPEAEGGDNTMVIVIIVAAVVVAAVVAVVIIKKKK